KTADPKQIIKKNEQRVADLSTLKTSISVLSNKITPTLNQNITEIITQITDLTEKVAALSVAQFASEPVQPVGTGAWKELLKAAISYNEEAYPNDTFPPSALEAHCVLCHQKLDKNSELRLKRFFDMVTSDVEKQLAQARLELKSCSVILSKINLTFFNQGSAVRRSLQEIDAVLEVLVFKHIEGYESVINALNQAILIESNPQLSLLEYDSVLGRIDILIQNIQGDTEKLRLDDTQTLINELLQEQQLLDDRKYLSEQYDNIVKAVNNLKWVEKANICLRTLSNTQREVTSKQKALAKELVAQGFIQRFTDNCKSLRLTLPVQFKFAGDAGTTDRKIEIANAGVNGIDPSQVLSEGEQTAAALADFLTEIELNGACAGVIFDDPVTSMDHVRKESIAERLVDEATRRQVIVFTHDILFTNYLATAAEDKGVAFAGRTVWRNDNDEPGVIDRLAFPHEYYEGAAYDRAKKQAEAAKSLSGDSQRDALEKACGNLRTAYEDFIQKKLFNNVVRRWRENITFTLNQVYFDENIAKRVHDRMGALSRYIDAHSHSNEYHEAPLTVEFIMLECATFDSIKSDYGKSRKAWEQSKPKSVFD
ncbi:MAG: AAA family ATPase, partial [Methylotenera sp.]